jgi:hypothetical protein
MSELSSPRLPRLAAMQTVEAAQRMEPKWLRIPVASRISGLSRTHLFNAIARDEIRSVHVKQPGNEKGIRLISFESLMQYVESFGEVA